MVPVGWAVFDLFIVFFLMSRRTRPLAYFVLIIFHVITGLMFPIGMFPWIMILSTLIFFSDEFHQKIIAFIATIFRFKKDIERIHLTN